MMSCAVSTAWSHPVLLYCCTEHSQQHGVTQSIRTTTIAMSRSGQLGQHCTVALHCSASLQVMMAPFVLTSCKRLDNARACLGNT
jgi:hypothetical protein